MAYKGILQYKLRKYGIYGKKKNGHKKVLRKNVWFN